MAKEIDDKEEKVVIRAVGHDEEGRKRVEKTELDTHNLDTIKYVEKKLRDKGVQRMDRHSGDGTGIRTPARKSGRGGKYTWEGPGDIIENQMSPAPAAIDERDPNYVDEEEEEEKEDKVLRSEVEVSKVQDVDPRLNAQFQ